MNFDFKKIFQSNPEDFEYNRVVSQISLLAVIISTFLGFLYWILRFGFDDNSVFVILKTLSASYFLLLSPNFVKRFIDIKRRNLKDLWCYSLAFVSVVSLFFLVFLGYISLIMPIKFIFLMLPIGFLLLFLFLFDYFSNFYKKRDLWLIVLFIIFSFWVGGLIWGTKYHSPLFFEKIILGLAHPDTLSYSAVSNLIKTYGFPSTGLDGLPYFHFHWGSNWIFAYLSELINVSVIIFYNLGYLLMFIPFYFKSLLLFIVDFKKHKNFSSNLELLVFVVLFVTYIDRGNFADLGNESYLISISFAFLLFSIIISFWQNVKSKIGDYSITDKLFLFLFIPFFIGIIGLMKISVGFLLFGLYGYLFLRMRWYKKKEFFISFIVFFLIFIVTYLAVSNKGAINDTVTWLHLIEYIKSWNLFFSITYLWLWIFIFIILYQEKITTLHDLKEAFLQKKLLELEVFFVIAVLGLLPGAVLNIAGGSAWYFSNFQELLGLGFVLAYLSHLAENEKEILRFSWKKLKMSLVLIIFVISVDKILFLEDYYVATSQLIVTNIIVRERITNPQDINFSAKKFVLETLREKGFVGTLKSAIPAAKLSQPELLKLKNYELIKTLEKIGKMKRSEKRKTCVYIPKSNKIFWEMDIYKDYSFVRPFVVPAITGLAMIDGLPQEEPPDIYGYYYYKKERQGSAVAQPLDFNSNEDIKKIVEEKGFSQVIIIKQEGLNLVVEKI